MGLTILVIISRVGEGNLPSQPAVAGLVVSAWIGLRIPNSLGEREPLWLVFGRIGELVFGGQHGGHAPEALVVVSQRSGMVGGHVVFIVAGLVKHALHDDLVVGRVAGQVPVVDVGAHHGAAFPPVVVALVLSGRPG